jgi:hypothetical protein
MGRAGFMIVDDLNQRVVVMSDLYERLKFCSQIAEFDVPLLEKSLGITPFLCSVY